MKKTLSILALAVSLVAIQSCGSKKENKEDNVATETPVVKATEPTRAEKRAALDKARAEAAERRRLDYENRVKISVTYTDAKGNVVYNKAEVDPTFNGGDEAMMKYLNDNVSYPTDAKDKGVEGTVYVDFVVSADGTVREVVATDAAGEDVDQSLRDEAVRVVTSMPKWTPGRQRGKAVDVKFSVPITFQMQ